MNTKTILEPAKSAITSGNCKDCRYWERHIDIRNKKFSTCGRVDWVDYADKIPEDGAAIYAYASDDSGMEVGLKTGPLFGCVKFQPKRLKAR